MNLINQLRDYAANNGYSHNDYADTMRQAADRIAELEARTPAGPENAGLMGQAEWLKSRTPAAPVVAEGLTRIANMLEGYAKNYEGMARQNPDNPRVNMTSVAQDIRQNMKGFVLELAAHPVAGSPVEAKKATLGDVWASGGVHWDLFPGFLIDTREGDILTEEGLQFALAAMLKDADYLRVVAERHAAEPMPAGEAASEPVAYLHQVVAGDGEPDQALSFAPDNFPLSGKLGYRSISHQPLYLAAPVPASEAASAMARRLIWLAFVWNDHNFDAAHKEARAECEKWGIKTKKDAEKFYESLAAPAASTDARPDDLHNFIVQNRDSAMSMFEYRTTVKAMLSKLQAAQSVRDAAQPTIAPGKDKP